MAGRSPDVVASEQVVAGFVTLARDLADYWGCTEDETVQRLTAMLNAPVTS